MFKLQTLVVSLYLLQGFAHAAGDDQTLRAYAESEKAKGATIGLFDGTLPHFVDGDSWQSTIVLTNLVDKPVGYAIFFRDDTGNPLQFNFVGLGKLSLVTGVLAIGQTIELATTGASSVLVQGNARMFNFDRSPDQTGAQVTDSRIGGYAIFRRRLPGLPDQEAVVPMSDPFEKKFSILFDNRNGFLTGVAIINDSSQNGSLTVVARDQTGAELINETTSMASGSKQVYLVPDKYPALAGKAGVLQYSISSIGLSGLGLRFNPTGSFTSTQPLSY